MKRYITEFVGTFFLVLTIGCTVIPATSAVTPPLAIGVGLTALVYAGAHLSGAHYNPAVTVALFLRGRFDGREVAPYFVAELGGAAVGALAVGFLVGAGSPLVIDSVPRVFVAELLFTFALVFVILNVATVRANEGNSFYGIAIGFVVMAGAYAVGDVSGAAFNPAVGLALGLLDLVRFADLWIHVVAELVGAVAATGVFKLVYRDA